MKVYEALNILERAERELNRNGRPEDMEIELLKDHIKDKYGDNMGEIL